MEDSWACGGGGDAAEGRRAEAAVGLGEGRGVGDVEHLGAELQLGLLGDVGAFDEGHLEVAVGRTADAVAGGVAEDELWCSGEKAAVLKYLAGVPSISTPLTRRSREWM